MDSNSRRRKMIAGNWKMNCDFEEAEMLADEIIGLYPAVEEFTEIVLAPPFPFLELVGDIVLERMDFSLSAQNCSEMKNGAYTGEISAEMLATLGCEYIIVGHSERRHYFKETNAVLKEKVMRCLENDISPIYCIGETLEERKGGNYKEVISEQLHSLWSLDPKEFANIVFAYEPVWAIGTGETASPEQAEEVHEYIRLEIAKKMSAEISENSLILYGGSVKPNNAKALFSQKNIDGGLIGGASLNAADFVAIIKAL